MKTRIKKTFICSDVNHYVLDKLKPKIYIPQVGDVAIFEVLTLGKHLHMQCHTGRNATIIPGDWIMGAFGTRYATGQFEGYVPTTCIQEFDILGAGGTIGIVHSMHEQFQKIGTTRLKIIGYVITTYGDVINTIKIKEKSIQNFTGYAAKQTKVILSVGSSMDSGKTTTAGYLINGLKKQGAKVAYVKLTGTVYTKDKDFAYDLGADIVTDFADFGFPSTYLCSEDELLNLYESCVQKVLIENPDFVVIEIADGLYQRETKMLLSNSSFMDTVKHIIFSSGDSLSAVNGIEVLSKWCIPPFAVSGMFTTSPLLIQEVKGNTNIPVFTKEELSEYGCKLLLKNKSNKFAA